MRLALLGCAAALTLIGGAAAQAETIYTTETEIVPADTVYAAPATDYVAPVFGAPRVVVTEPAPATIVEPAPYIAVAPNVVAAPLTIAPPQHVIERERVVVGPRERLVRERIIREPAAPSHRRAAAAPRERVIRERVFRDEVVPREEVLVAPREHVIVAPPSSGVVTTGYSAGSCSIDLNGFERCY